MTDRINAMTLEEKIAQLKGTWLKELLENDEVSLEKCREKIPHGIGHICQFGSSNSYDANKLAKLVYDVQQYHLTETNAKIPVLFHEEVIDGVAAKGSTVTPQMLGMACSFNPSLVHQNAKNAGQSIKNLGAYYALSPMMDIITDARWARGEEGFGEDSYVVSVFADAFITGLQSQDVGATAKHYAGYGVANQEHDFFINETLAPFEVAVSKSGVKAIMPGYHMFRDVPAACSKELLVDSLRGHLGFTGAIVSDYGAITNIHREYNFTETAKQSAILAMQATNDVDFPLGANYDELLEAVRNGELDEALIDQAVARVLTLKSDLMPDSVTLTENIDLDPAKHRVDALKSARESIVLLKNDGILPLADKPTKLLVTGPNADSYYSLLGDYSWGGLAEFFRGIPIDRMDPMLVTLLSGLQQQTNDNFTVDYARGFNWAEAKADVIGGGDDRAKDANRKPLEVLPETDFDKALQKANDCDIIVAAVGENRYLCGESTSRDDINLPGKQAEYVQTLIDTGKPVIMVVFGGRPMAIASLAKQCAAVLYAWYPGEEGGTACAEIMLGKVNPTAKLAVTIPDVHEDAPVCLKDQDRTMQFPFGFGLSYTSFAYSDFDVPCQVNTANDGFELSFNVQNTGAVDGAEITQIYCTNRNTGDKKVFGFTKTWLKAGEQQRVTMHFSLDQFGRYREGQFHVFASDYDLMIGSSSVQVEYQTALALVGDTKIKPKRTVFFSETVQ